MILDIKTSKGYICRQTILSYIGYALVFFRMRVSQKSQWAELYGRVGMARCHTLLQYAFSDNFYNHLFRNSSILFLGIPKLKLSLPTSFAKFTATRFPFSSITGEPLEPCTVGML